MRSCVHVPPQTSLTPIEVVVHRALLVLRGAFSTLRDSGVLLIKCITITSCLRFPLSQFLPKFQVYAYGPLASPTLPGRPLSLSLISLTVSLRCLNCLPWMKLHTRCKQQNGVLNTLTSSKRTNVISLRSSGLQSNRFIWGYWRISLSFARVAMLRNLLPIFADLFLPYRIEGAKVYFVKTKIKTCS